MEGRVAGRMKKLLIALSFGYGGIPGGSPGNALFASKWKMHVYRFLRQFAIWKVLDQSERRCCTRDVPWRR
jgi:hypothetical protein